MPNNGNSKNVVRQPRPKEWVQFTSLADVRTTFDQEGETLLVCVPASIFSTLSTSVFKFLRASWSSRRWRWFEGTLADEKTINSCFLPQWQITWWGLQPQQGAIFIHSVDRNDLANRPYKHSEQWPWVLPYRRNCGMRPQGRKHPSNNQQEGSCNCGVSKWVQKGCLPFQTD